MSDNVHLYGFRAIKGSLNGSCFPKGVPKSVASGYQAQDDAAGFNVDLNVGDPIQLAADGTVTLSNAGDPTWGVILGFNFYYNNVNRRMEPNDRLPGGSVWSGEQQRPWLYVVPAGPGQLFEIDVNDNVTATTYADYLALVGQNVTHVCPGNEDARRADPYLDISSASTSAGLNWRIEGVSQTQANRDYSGLNVKLIVSANIGQQAGQAATTIAGV